MIPSGNRVRTGAAYGVAALVAMSSLAPWAAAADGPADEVVVTGERPGPALWRVTRGDHTLWLLGVLDPLPRHMTWRSATADAIVADAEVVLPESTSVSVDAGPFAMIGLYFDWRRVRRLPDGQTLRDVVPAGLYARFEVQRQHYAPTEELEHYRPIVAAGELYRRAIKAAGLRGAEDVEESVLRTARRHHVEVRDFRVRVDAPKTVLRELAAIPLAAELACLEYAVRRLEADVPAMQQRARAWAVGDVEQLRRTQVELPQTTCWDVIELSPRLHALGERARAERASALEAALRERRSAVALVPIDRLLAPDGLLQGFRAEGYAVEEP